MDSFKADITKTGWAHEPDLTKTRWDKMLFRCHLAWQIKHVRLTCHTKNARWHTLFLQINSTGCIKKKLTYPLSKEIIRDINFLSTHPVYCSNALTYSTAEKYRPAHPNLEFWKINVIFKESTMLVQFCSYFQRLTASLVGWFLDVSAR